MFLEFALFGIWTLIAMFVGAFLMHRKQERLSPMPNFDPAAMLNWVRTGKVEKKEGDDAPPFDPEVTRPVNFEL